MTDKDIEEILKLLGLKEGEDYAVDSKQANYCQTVSDFPEVNNPSYVTTTATSYHSKGIDPSNIKEFNFDEVVEETITSIRKTLLVKGKEYIRNNNPFHNFDVGSDFTGMIPEDYLFALNTKHIASIRDLIEDLYDEEKAINIAQVEEKIGDAITYLILLEGLFKRRLNS